MLTKLERKLPSYLSSPLMAIRHTREGLLLSTITPCAITSAGSEAVAVETLFCTSTAPMSMSYPGSK